MGKNLVIVESPAKAKTISGFLGKDFVVKSSFGHVRDLSKKQLGVDIDHGFRPQYELDPEKKKIIQELKKSAKEAGTVWLASDEDREGEAISWHLMEVLGLEKEKVRRIVFHEITKTAITQAIERPREIDMNLVDAQQARRVLDRLVGFELSPLLWKKVKPSLSAGRVQSVAVRLIVEREKEIEGFNTEAAYRITARFIAHNGESQETMLEAEHPERFAEKDQAMAFLGHCIGAAFTVSDVEKKPARRSPAPPFTTSTLQQEASRKLGFSVSRTMTVAQQLYESGKITYMRTDSVHLSEMALGMARQVIGEMYGKEYVKTRQFTTSSKGAQEAHEAIRPTFLQNTQVEGSADQRKLYDLIWKRTIASQMSDATLERTIITIAADTLTTPFQARGEVILFDGFLKVYFEGRDEEDEENGKGMLPALRAGDRLHPKDITATQRFSKAPPRYTEASLVKKMEELGIGRPSTYAPTISTILKREYVVKEDRPGSKRDYTVLTLKGQSIKEDTRHENVGYEKAKLFPTDIGTLVNEFLMMHFDDIMDYNFTASVEKQFDEIAEGQKEWSAMIRDFYTPFHSRIEKTGTESSRFSGERLLGLDPESGKNVYAKVGHYGPMIQIGD
ncbi:MAG TPA: type I DNA topoisomerase, partial [Bacteroidales bacterium]|nr:type I DNA topoisomerase [Bacteroidales bacterium]